MSNFAFLESHWEEIKLPPLEEQRVSASLLRSVMDQERQAKEASVFIIEEIDVMKKSILAKAFRGEFGTNNPMEESSMELLKQIIESR